MAVFMGAKGEDILSSRSTIDLVRGIEGELKEKMAYLPPEEEMKMLLELEGRLEGERRFEEETDAAFAGIASQLRAAEFVDILPVLQKRFESLARDYFARRGSILALQGLYNAWQDVFLAKVLELAAKGLEDAGEGLPPGPFCLMAAGGVGRQEQAVSSRVEYFLVNKGSVDGTVYFDQLAYRVIAVLEKCGLIGSGGRTELMHKVWHGSAQAWKEWVEDELRREDDPDHAHVTPLASLAMAMKQHHQESWEISSTLFLLADLRRVHGDPDLAAALKEFAAAVLAREQGKDRFYHLSRRVSAMPLARGFFGGFRVKKSGDHRGEFDLDGLAIAPLVLNVAVLACRFGIPDTGTMARINNLVYRGSLGVELGERLLKAFHLFHCLRRQLCQQSGVDCTAGMHVNPDSLSEQEVTDIKNGLDAVTTLQQIVYQVSSQQG